MKIVNKKKFIKSIIILLTIILLGSLFISKSTFSHGENKYVDLVINTGDTLWSIASELQCNSEYYKSKDIREIIYSLQKNNNIKDTNLYNGQILKVNEI